MSAATFVDELHGAGIRLSRAGDDLVADVLPGTDLETYRLRITEHRPAILIELLQREIVGAASAARDAFDRGYFDGLWERWYVLQQQEAAEPCR